jgi:hypothetical protein
MVFSSNHKQSASPTCDTMSQVYSHQILVLLKRFTFIYVKRYGNCQTYLTMRVFNHLSVITQPIKFIL